MKWPKNPNLTSIISPGNFATYYTTGMAATWCGLTDNSENEKCVDIYGSKDDWGDHPCSLSLPYICEKPSCSGCWYNGKWFQEGAIVKKNPRTCSRTICQNGGIW